jgi:MAF protein
MSSPSLLVLASASPRRRELLARLGVPFLVRPPALDEETAFASFLRSGQQPDQVAKGLAHAKARDVAATLSGALVLGADTLVVLDDRVLGKPRTAEEAREMLRALRDRQHTVITGVAVVEAGTERGLARTVRTRVWMRPYSDEEIDAYIARGEPFDKAGGYAIQDPLFAPVARWQGCYSNVVGLPLRTTAELLAHFGLAVPNAVHLPQASMHYLPHERNTGRP